MNPNLSNLTYNNVLEIVYFLYKIIYFRYSYKEQISKLIKLNNINNVTEYIEMVEIIENQEIDNFSEKLVDKYFFQLNELLQKKTMEYIPQDNIKSKNMLLELRESVKI